ncbi:MAG: protein-L-isoaspartate(D-aspartate) O-methyltransferase [Bauldia sp.]|nr:protein-L-isoaspartate(D-aspartate) O-methyltransferase [Bauldia sp.]
MSEPPVNPADFERDRTAVADFLLRLRRKRITDPRILAAFEAVPRRLFVPHSARDNAYLERALPIECGQSISAPELVATMTAALDVTADAQVLEIGTGSGYQAAVLSRLARRVYTIDRFRTLVEFAELRFRTLKLQNITTLVGDGTLGWPANAVFDRIVVTAATEKVPDALFRQLRPRGILVAPVGPVEGVQKLTRYAREDRGIHESVLADVRFVPLIPGKAERL